MSAPCHLHCSAALTNGGWQHVALTYDTNSANAVLYTNGQQAVAVKFPAKFVPRTSGDLYLGYHPTSPTNGVCYAGGLDEFSLYQRALSPCEVNAIFNAGSRGKYGTNVLVCPVATEVTLLTAAGNQTLLSPTASPGPTTGRIGRPTPSPSPPLPTRPPSSSVGLILTARPTPTPPTT